MFPIGLAIGACVAIINLNILSKSIEKAVDQKNKTPVTIAFYIRMALYIGGLFLALNVSLISGLGAAVGFLIPCITISITKALIPAIKRRITKEPAPVYVVDTKSNIFIKDPWIVLYKNNRTYVTYRHFRKRRVA